MKEFIEALRIFLKDDVLLDEDIKIRDRIEFSIDTYREGFVSIDYQGC